MKSSKIVDLVNYFFLAIFLLCVAVQYNDPDPVQWMVIYGAGALCCIFFAMKRLPSYLPACVALAAFFWALFIVLQVWGIKIQFDEVFKTIHMLSPGVEEIREIGGLLIVVFWMIVLFFKTRV